MPEIHEPNNHELPEDLLRLYDALSEHDAYCAFLCDAVAALTINREQWLDDRSVQGLCFFTQWVKKRSAELTGELDAVRRAQKRPPAPYG